MTSTTNYIVEIFYLFDFCIVRNKSGTGDRVHTGCPSVSPSELLEPNPKHERSWFTGREVRDNEDRMSVIGASQQGVGTAPEDCALAMR